MSIPFLRRYPALLFYGLATLCGALSQAASGEVVYIAVGTDFQSAINTHPPGTKYVVRAGVHRGVTVVPKDGDTISGEPGAVLNGCLQLADWRQEGGWWVHDVPVLVPEISPVGVYCTDMICTQTQDLYVDNDRLYAVRTQAKVLDDGQWFLDRTASRVYMRRNPTGREVELGGPSPVAIDCSPPGLPPRQGVIIEDLVIEKYPTPPQRGSVRLGALGGSSVLRRCEIRQSHAHGVQLMGSATVQDCYLHDNGMCGIGGIAIGATIEGCEISENAWSYYAGEAWDNGGIKIAGSADSTIRRCYVHHNHGPGIWSDVASRDLLVEHNIIELNDWEGALFEISNNITIRRNICRWNGVHLRGRTSLWGAQICIQNANFIEVDSNYLECGPGHGSPWGSGQGVMAINQNERAVDEGVFGGDFSVHDINVHHNVTVIPFAGHSGVDYGILGWDTYEDFLNAGLSWHDNRYLAGQPLGLNWSWRVAEGWDETIARWWSWEDWLTYQDKGSTLEIFRPDDYTPTGTKQWALMAAVTGLDYPVLKAQLTRRPPPSAADSDSDGLPDAWEKKYFGSLVAGGSDDPDGEGWDNAREFSEHTDPTLGDTDHDGVAEPWESSHGFDPTVFDSNTDADLDGRSVLEEYEDGTNPAVAESPDQLVPEANLSLWLETVSGLVRNGDGTLKSWTERGPHRRAVGWAGKPAVTGASPTGLPLVDPGIYLACPGAPGFWGTATSGFTMTFVYQPTAIDLSKAAHSILTNESYGVAGFRLRLEAGYLVLDSGQSGGSLRLVGLTRLEAGRCYIISIRYAAPGGRHALYLDGRVEAREPAGLIVPGANFLMLGNTGGVTPQPGRFGEVVVFDRALTHWERRAVEHLLREKFQTGFPGGFDRDLDGVPDAYERGHGLDPTTPDALGDGDNDGVANRLEYEHGTDPQDSDTDDDELSDGWEIDLGLNPLVQNDSDGDGLPDFWELRYFAGLAAVGSGDADGDGWDNAREFREHTNPMLSDTDNDGLPDAWEPSHGLDPAVPDSDGDVDLDGRSLREEYEDGTDPAVAESLDQPVPEASLSLWLETVSGLVTRTDGTVQSWTEHGPHRRAVAWAGTPAVTGSSPAARPLVDPGSYLACPGNPGFWGTPTSGFTMTFVYQPTAIDLSSTPRAILTNESYLVAGFRLRLEAGYLVLHSGQGGGSLHLAGLTRLEAGRCYIISIHCAAPGGLRALYLDGRVEAWKSTGLILPSANFLMLGNTGGVMPQPGRFGDVVVFDRALSHRERRTVERLLREKFQTGFPPRPDRDLDRLPDAYELGHQLDPVTPDARGDGDNDGVVNSVEFERGTDPQDSDTDDDELSDGWEIDHGLNPLVQNDSDGDGLPDFWELRYFAGLAAVGSGDADGDGWDNAREFREHTNPMLSDTDNDGLPDPWEAGHGLNPKVSDSDGDADLDGRSIREEYEDGTDPAVAEPLDQPVPEASLSLWLETVSGLVANTDGTLQSWTEHGPDRRPVGWAGVPAVIGTSPAGRPLVDPGTYLSCPGDPTFWGTASSGFTMSFVYRPTSIELSAATRAILTNESYLAAGFRLRLEAGYLVLDSGSSGGNLRLAGETRLEAGRSYIISIHYAGAGGLRALYLDGRVEVWKSTGLILPSSNFLMLGNTGGVTPQPGRFGDVVVFDRALSHRERRTVERLLGEKFQTGFPPRPDRDLDRLPDAYELEHQLDPMTPDARGDGDHDGAVNSLEFERGTDPLDPDTENDGMPDGWEMDHGLDPLLNDANADPDGDGATNVSELGRGSDPKAADTDQDGMPDGWEMDHALNPLVDDATGDPDGDGATNLTEFEQGADPHVPANVPPAVNFGRLRLWWRSDTGLAVADQKVTRWVDSSPGTHDGVPLAGGDGPSIVTGSPAERPSIIGSTSGLLAAGDLDLSTVGQSPGTTVLVVLRSPVIASPPGVFRPLLAAGGTFLGAIDDKVAARSAGGGTLLTAPAALRPGLNIVSLTLPTSPGKARLYVDGRFQAEGDGIVPVLAGPVQLGGMTDTWPAQVCEVMVFAGVLSDGDRQLAQRVLAGKWQGGGLLASDSDDDGLPDWWEWEAATDPAFDDAAADADFDGLSNLSAFQQGRCGFMWKDDDRDGMHDGWESAHGLNPQINDADLDLDLDGHSNALEHALGTGPEVAGDASDAWGIVSTGGSVPGEPRVTLWNNHRSWKARAVVEGSDSLSPGGWHGLAAPVPLGAPQDGISRLFIPIPPAKPAEFFRLRLLNE